MCKSYHHRLKQFVLSCELVEQSNSRSMNGLSLWISDVSIHPSTSSGRTETSIFYG